MKKIVLLFILVGFSKNFCMKRVMNNQDPASSALMALSEIFKSDDLVRMTFFGSHIKNHDQTTLQVIIKNLMKLRSTCKTLDFWLTYKKIGNICKQYSAKDILLQSILEHADKPFQISLTTNRSRPTESRCFPALALLSAGENSKKKKKGWLQILLTNAVRRDDLRGAKELLQNQGVDPNFLVDETYPLLFFVIHKRMLQLLLTNKADINFNNYYHLHKYPVKHPNILWYSICEHRSPKFIYFYIKKGADAAILDDEKNTLWHLLVVYYSFYTPEDFGAIACLLSKKINHIINAINLYDETPLDVLYKTCFKQDILINLSNILQIYQAKRLREL